VRTIAIASLVVAAIAADVQAQAWVGEKGGLDVDLSYQYVPSSAVVFSPDEQIEDRPTRNHIITLGTSYVPIDKLELGITLPLAMVKYTGTTAHTRPGVWDDGKTHATLTDLRFGARYQLLDEPVALTPHLGASIPVADYEVVGFATGGRGLKMVHAGLNVGRLFGNLFVNVGYEFSLAERSDINALTEDIAQRRSDVEAQIGYFFLDGKIGVNLGMNWRLQHGGINFEDFPSGMVPIELIENHDPVLDEDFLFVGGGASYAITDKLVVSAITRFFLRGFNTRDQSLYGVGLSWTVL
jgi:hypothetical protein